MSPNRNQQKIVSQWERADRALVEATRRAVAQSRELELPIAVERDGKMVWLDPTGIELPSPEGPGGFVLEREVEAASSDNVREWLRQNCPTIFAMLKGKPKRVVPAGLLAYLSPRHHVETSGFQLDDVGTRYLQQAESAVQLLQQTAGEQAVASLGKRVASVGSEEEIIQLLCELSVCASVGRQATPGTLVLEPSTGPGRCDFQATLKNCEIWGEIKRYSDTWVGKPLPESHSESEFIAARSRALSVEDHRSAPEALRPARARAEVLRSKLDGNEGEKRGVPDQFLEGQYNVLFLFEDAWTPLPHVRAALLGDRFYFRDPEHREILATEGLFARKRWRKISACCWMTVSNGPLAVTQGLWLNPNAEQPLPEGVVQDLLSLGR